MQFRKTREQLRAFVRSLALEVPPKFQLCSCKSLSRYTLTSKFIPPVFDCDSLAKFLTLQDNSMTDSALENQVVRLSNLTNEEFLQRHAKPGRIGLSGGLTFVDKAICRAERHLDEKERWGLWSHAFFFQGARADGHHWLIESDLQVHRKHIQLGVQENRVSKYHDEKLYTNLAILDFGLSEGQVVALLREGLELVATARIFLANCWGR